MYNRVVRCGWVWLFLVFLPVVSLSGAPSSAGAIVSAQLSTELRASLTRDYEIDVRVQPHAGDAWTRLSRRLTGDAANWEELAAFNEAGQNLKRHQQVRVPFSLLKPSLQLEVASKLFPQDQRTREGWRHVVVGGRGIEGESLWKIAEWFTGDGANYSLIRKANPRQGLSTRKGDVILIPTRLLTATFGGSSEEENAPKKATEPRQRADDATQRAAADENVPEATAVAPLEAPVLTYPRNAAEPHALYRLQKGEALYSSVAIRFTGRVYARDVYQVLDRIVKYNEIEDVSRLPVGYAVKIPFDLLLPEYLPQDNPQRVAAETTLRESAKVARRTRATGLSGVHVILDPGHGGTDPGTAHDGLWESAYVYDVAVRLKRILEKQRGVRVSMTTRSKKQGFTVAERNVLTPVSDHSVLTTPAFVLDDAIVGVNLRWYLANSMFRRAMKEGTPKEKVVFLSIHADSLHPSLRGAMAYVPGASYVTGSYQKKDEIYLTRAEVREQPKVTHSRADALEAEGLSRDLAQSVMAAFSSKGLKVHPFKPVRDNVIRSGREWVPAIIRHNQVPTRMLLEVGNLGNPKDRQLLQTTKHREQLAAAIYQGIVDFYAAGRDESKPPASMLAKGAK